MFSRHIQQNYQPKHPGRSSTDTFAIGFEPPDNQSSEYGNLYICFEPKPNDRRIEPEKIIQGCGKSFYESGLENEFEKRFRLCVRALNELMLAAKTSCNISIIAIQGNKLLFSSVGKARMHHVRKNSSSDLATKEDADRFTDIGEGKLQSGDKLLLASQAVAANITSKEVAKLLSDYPLDDIPALLDAKLDIPKDIAYSYVVIGNENIPASVSVNEPGVSTQKSANNLSRLSENTGLYLNKLGSKFKHSSKTASKKMQKSAKSASSKIVPGVSSRTKDSWTSFWAKYINPKPKQAIIVVIITILIIIALIWAISSFLNTNNQSSKQFEQALTLIESAQSNFDKGNKSAAKENVSKAKDILNSLNENDQTNINQLANEKKLKLNFVSANQQAQGIIDKITNTTRLNTDDGFTIPQAKLASLIWTDNALYGIVAGDGSVIEINPLLGKPIVRGSNADLVDPVDAQALNGGGFVAIGKSGLWQYSASGGLQQLKVANLPSSVSVASYLSNIYLLSPGENQVVRYAKSGINLANRTDLLKNLSANSLSSATSLAVSGNVFVSQGKDIKLFEQGSERSYELRNLPDDFGEIAKLYQNPEQGYFIVLNKNASRLALLRTESDSASFVRQYALNDNRPIQAFTIEPTSSQLMLSSGNKIVTYKIEK